MSRSTLGMIATACFVALGAVAGVVAVVDAVPGDRWVLGQLHEIFGSSIDEPMTVVSDVTDTLALAAAALAVVAILLLQTRWRDAGSFVLAFGVVVATNPILKEIVDRPRPDIRPLPESVSAWSFPSGHAAGTAALVGAILVVVPGGRLRTVVVIGGSVLLAIVAFSQLVLSVHHPSDIVGGWLWAGAWVAVVVLLGMSRWPSRAGRP
jgi:membrane-associated phospholipid phosphatase